MRSWKTGNPFGDEAGFTTAGMALALIITISLVFTAAQVYRVGSASAEVQDVADAAALAAEAQVSEFMLVARFCDAVVLSLSLTGLAACGLGIAALCTPATATLSEGLLDAGRRLIDARNGFSDRATAALNKLQEALPFYAAACAASVSAANDGDSAGANYLGIAVLVPARGEALESDSDDGAGALLDSIEAQADGIREKAREAEDAAAEANRAKERAFARDCGDNPSYCMYERAGRLAGLTGGENPLYSSVDAWSFQVALDRARAYYRARLRDEAPASAAVDEQARSALRARFYRFAADELKAAYVSESGGSFEASFPHLPGNTAEMRLTSLYTETVYPVTLMAAEGEDPSQVAHAWMGCPEVQRAGISSLCSIADMEAASMRTCPVCGFTAASMGKVAAASTSIANGFEYHYDAVADEAAVYQAARHRADIPKSEVEEKAGGLLDELAEVAKATVGKRISPSPPGRFGAIAFVVNAGETPAAGPFASGFVAAAGSLGPRAAVSAAALVDEGSDAGRTALNSALDGLREDGGVAVGAAGIVLDAWSRLLVAYADGQGAVERAVADGLNALPLVGASGLGTWAAGKLSVAVEGVGLQPAQVGALKPALVNTAHVAAKGEGAFASGYVALKQRIVSHPLMSADLFSSLLTDAERQALAHVEGLGGSIQVASIELLGEGGPSVPITIPLPEPVRAQGAAAVQGLFARLRSFYFETAEVRTWE